MNGLIDIALGIVTGIGGFLEAGSLVTAAQAGDDFRFELIWAVLLGAICLAFLLEMCGRLAAVSKHTLTDTMRERFGIRLFVVPLGVMLLVMYLVLAAELGGVALALQLISGVSYRWWAPAVALLAWALLWKGTFGWVEKGVSMLGLVTVSMVIGAFRMHPPAGEVLAGLLPRLPAHDRAHYWYLAVSVLGASISPYLFFFYSSGAVEDRWNVSHLRINRLSSGLGMGFGAFVAVAALVLAAVILHPGGVRVTRIEQLPVLLTTPFGHWGFILFVAALGIACFGAAQEVALTAGYMMAQGFGWNWSENLPPAADARFSLTYTVMTLLAIVPVSAGVDILQLTNISMVLTAATLPLVVVPLLLIMNDERYLHEYRNGWISNTVVGLVTLAAFVLAVVSLPLMIAGG